MPYVADGPKGPFWTTAKGANLGLACGMGSGGREYVPGRIYRSDRMAATGLYDDGKKGIRRLTEPELRIKDQDRDGVQAEVLYGILGMTGRLADGEAAVEITRVYNEWLAAFCSTHPERFAGLAAIPNHPLEAAIAEVERVAKRGGCPGSISRTRPTSSRCGIRTGTRCGRSSMRRACRCTSTRWAGTPRIISARWCSSAPIRRAPPRR